MAQYTPGRAPDNIRKHLKGVTFPADKEAIVYRVEKNDPPPAVLEFFHQLPDRTYEEPVEVMDRYDDQT